MHGGLAGLVEHEVGHERNLIGVKPYCWKRKASIRVMIITGLRMLVTG